MSLFLYRLAFGICLIAMMANSTLTAHAELVTVSIADPLGTSDVNSKSNYIGIVDGIAPLTLDGRDVDFKNVPAGESFQVGDLIGQDVDDTAGSLQWEYSLTLPIDAIAGTGFQDIMFLGHAFESDKNNLEATDVLTWELFLNNSSTSVVSSGGGDFDSMNVSLTNAGGVTINDVRVVFTVSGFNSNKESFATRGVLSASYMAVPESRALLALLPFLIGLFLRRRA